MLRVPHVGQLADALGPIYLAYGRALMQVAIEKQDQALLNQKVTPGQSADANDEEDEGEEEDGPSSMLGKKRKLIDIPDIIPETVEEDDDKGKQKVVSHPRDEDNGGDQVEQEEEAEANDSNEAPVVEEEDDDFRLAWEILDVARLIYSRMDTPLGRQVTADIHMDLGDLQMENEQFDQAISDYHQSLAILSSSNDPNKGSNEHKRALASVHFKLGIALEYSGKMEDALRPFGEAHALLSTCLADQKEKGGDPQTPGELDELVTEIGMKIADIRSELEKSASLKAKGVIVEDGDESSPGFKQTLAKDEPVNDLSSLVKKRKVAQ